MSNSTNNDISSKANNNLAPNVTVIEPYSKSLEDEIKALIRGTNKQRVCAYARVSTEQEEQQSSYDAQVSYYTKYIQNNPEWEFAGVYADEGISGTSTKKRDGFNKMIRAAKKGEIDLILTKSISRFARNTVDTLQIVRELKAIDVEVYFEKENIHTLDPKCEMILTIMSSLAQEESRSISENVKWGKEKSMREGNVYMPYGHFMGYKKGEDGRPEIVEEEAKIIRSIYDMFLSGKSIRQITDYLTDTGITTPGGKNKWSISTVRSILSNEKYKGEAMLQKTYTTDYLTKHTKKNEGEKAKYHITNSHPPIISPDIYDRTQRELEKRATYRSRSKKDTAPTIHPFFHRIICDDCKAFYGHKVWRSRGKNRIRYDVWYCNHRYEGENKCTTPTLKEDDIKNAFTKALKRVAKNNETKDNPIPEIPDTYNEALWWELVESVTITSKNKAIFQLNDGNKITVAI